MFTKTNTVNGHYHVASIEHSAGAGATSLDRGHQHQVYRSPQADAALQDLRDWATQPAEDGHVHDIVALEPIGEKPVKEPEADVVAESVRIFQACQELESDSRTKSRESERFYCGEQWDNSIKSTLKSKKRACLTINHVEPMVDLLSGYQRQNRQDIKFLPVEGGDQKTADLLTMIVKNVADMTNLEVEESKVFEDMVVQGRGIFHVYVSFDDDDVDGRIVIERFDPDDVWFGAHSKDDLSDCGVAIKARWFSIQQAKNLFPELEDEICATYDLIEDDDTLRTDGFHLVVKGDQYNVGNGKEFTAFNSELVSIARKEIRIYEIWRREYRKTVTLLLSDGTKVDTSKWKPQDAAKAARVPGVDSIERNTTRMRRTIMVGHILVDDSYPKMPPGTTFALFPSYAKKRKNQFWGKVEAAKDSQREINKRRSQGIDVVNKMAAYGWLFDATTFATDKAKNEFLNNCTSPGFSAEIADLNRPPKQVEGIRFPSELVQMSELANADFRVVTSVSMEWINGASDTTGAALIERRRQGMAANEFLFDNLAQAKRRMVKTIVSYLKSVYTAQRVARLVMGKTIDANGQPVALGGQPINEFSEQDIKDLFDNADLLKYDVVVGESAWSPTYRRAAFAQLSELAGRGVAIPTPTLLELSDVPNKGRVLQQLSEQAQAQAQSDKSKSDMELGKTAIAKGIDPKAVTGNNGPGSQGPQQ